MINKNNGPSQNMCNNDVTYHDQWDTKKNKHYQTMALAIARKSHCRSSVPLSWAREVYFFLSYLDSKYGIAYATQTMDGYYLPKGVKGWLTQLVVRPIRRFPSLLKTLYKDVFKEPSKWKKQSAPTRLLRVKETLFGYGGMSGYFYGYRALKHVVYGFFYNKVKKPQIHLAQFKEKFGYVTVYYDAPTHVKQEVNRYIKKLTYALSKKGAYYKVEEKVK